MAISRFLQLQVLVDGVTQLLLQNVTVNWDAQKQPVETMRGLAGFTPGAKRITIQATSAVRTGGPEFDAFESASGDTQHEIQVPYGPKTIVSEGEIMSGSLSGSVNASTEHQFEFMGTYNPPK
jgi:hypothetical protein